MIAKLNIKLHENQQVMEDSDARFKVLKCGKRFGKSTWACYALARKAGATINGTFWYIAPTYGMAEERAWKEFDKLIPRDIIRKINKTDLEITLSSGSTIRLKGADNPNTLRGIGLDGLVFDECAQAPNGFDLWNSILRNQIIDKKGFAYFLSTPFGVNWFTTLFNEAQRRNAAGDKEWESFIYTTFDNPHIDKEELLKSRDDMSEDAWQQEIMAQEFAGIGLKYHEFRWELNVGEYKGEYDLPVVRSIDWGGSNKKTSHPTACLWIKVDVKNKVVYVYDEYYKMGEIINVNANAIKEKTGHQPIEWTVIDPSSNKEDPITGRKLKDEFARLGVYCLDGDRRDRGVEIVKVFLKQGRVKISPKCKNLIRELQHLQYGDDLNNDAVDALRYGITRIHDYMFGGNTLGNDEPVKMDMSQVRKEFYNANNIFKKEESRELGWMYEEVN